MRDEMAAEIEAQRKELAEQLEERRQRAVASRRFQDMLLAAGATVSKSTDRHHTTRDRHTHKDARK